MRCKQSGFGALKAATLFRRSSDCSAYLHCNDGGGGRLIRNRRCYRLIVSRAVALCKSAFGNLASLAGSIGASTIDSLAYS